jgi:hypothetical protein
MVPGYQPADRLLGSLAQKKPRACPWQVTETQAKMGEPENKFLLPRSDMEALGCPSLLYLSQKIHPNN